MQKPLFVGKWKPNDSPARIFRKIVKQLRGLSVERNEKIFRLHGGPPEFATEMNQLPQWWKEDLFQFPHLSENRALSEKEIAADRTAQAGYEVYLVERFKIIMKMNGFGNLLYDDISRFNHACDANAEYCVTRSQEHGYIQVVRDIKVNEEINISYLDTKVLTEVERKAKLKGWGFSCKCTWCDSESEDRAKYEEKRIQLYLAQRRDPKKGNAAELYEFALQNIEAMETRGQCGFDYLLQYANHIIFSEQ